MRGFVIKPTSVYPQLPSVVVATGNESLVLTAQSELVRAVRTMYSRTLRIEKHLPDEDAIVLGTAEKLHESPLSAEAYRIAYGARRGHRVLIIAGATTGARIRGFPLARAAEYGSHRVLQRGGERAEGSHWLG